MPYRFVFARKRMLYMTYLSFGIKKKTNSFDFHTIIARKHFGVFYWNETHLSLPEANGATVYLRKLCRYVLGLTPINSENNLEK